MNTQDSTKERKETPLWKKKKKPLLLGIYGAKGRRVVGIRVLLVVIQSNFLK